MTRATTGHTADPSTHLEELRLALLLVLLLCGLEVGVVKLGDVHAADLHLRHIMPDACSATRDGRHLFDSLPETIVAGLVQHLQSRCDPTLDPHWTQGMSSVSAADRTQQPAHGGGATDDGYPPLCGYMLNGSTQHGLPWWRWR